MIQKGISVGGGFLKTKKGMIIIIIGSRQSVTLSSTTSVVAIHMIFFLQFLQAQLKLKFELLSNRNPS